MFKKLMLIVLVIMVSLTLQGCLKKEPVPQEEPEVYGITTVNLNFYVRDTGSTYKIGGNFIIHLYNTDLDVDETGYFNNGRLTMSIYNGRYEYEVLNAWGDCMADGTFTVQYGAKPTINIYIEV